MLVGLVEARSRPGRLKFGNGVIGATVWLAEFALIVMLSIVTGATWHAVVYGAAGDVAAYAGVGALTGLLYTLPFAFRSGYRLERLMETPRSLTHVLNVWTYTFFCLGALAFVTKTTGLASRGWLALFFVLGGIGVALGSVAADRAIRYLINVGYVAPRRLIVVGRAAEVSSFVKRVTGRNSGVQVVSSTVLPDDASPELADRLIQAAAERARSKGIDDVVILAGWAQTHAQLAGMAERFLDLPVAVHLARMPLTEQFPNLQVASVGSIRTLALRPVPLSAYQLAAKRALDVVAASLGLLLLAPLFLIVAILIKADSSGPVFFRQRRLGYNQKEFTIWKFRSMTSLDDGEKIEQARSNDPRVTRVGQFLRRYNLDELPQLINVLFGDMALVGPRPHAVAHDTHYGRIIRRYQRRLNVKPGITGWAQVNGFRGQTINPHAMRSRIAHDLYYIDNWSLAFDIYIILMTALSPKAFRNAV